MDIPITALASTVTPTTVPIAASGATSAADQEHFRRLLEIVPSGSEPVAATPVAAETVARPPATVGEAILDGLRGVSQDFQQRWQKVDATFSDPAKLATVTDMLRLQSQMLQLSVQYEMVGKAVSRSTQNIEQLIKIQ